MMAQIIGAAATLAAFLMFVPQAIAVWRQRHHTAALQAISLGTPALLLASSVLFCVYAYLTRAWWSGAPGLMNTPLALFIIFTVSRSRRHAIALIRSRSVHDAHHTELIAASAEQHYRPRIETPDALAELVAAHGHNVILVDAQGYAIQGVYGQDPDQFPLTLLWSPGGVR